MFVPFECSKARCDWTIIEKDVDGNIISQKELENVILDTGHVLIFRNLFCTAGSAGLVALAVGASTTTAVATQTSLVRELSGNATRKPLTNTSGAAVGVSDITQDITTIGGIDYRWKVVAKASFDTGDGNNGNQFGEFSLVTKLNFAAANEIFYNRLVDPAPTVKNSGNTIEVQVTTRYG